MSQCKYCSDKYVRKEVIKMYGETVPYGFCSKSCFLAYNTVL